MHINNYLINKNEHVITSQYKAYNDYIRMSMMIDLILVKSQLPQRVVKSWICGVITAEFARRKS